MPTWLADAPVAAIAALFAVAMLRGQATYWIVRLATRGAAAVTQAGTSATASEGSAEEAAAERTDWRSRARRFADSRGVRRARAGMQRWGLGLIPLCYLTVGLQTAVLSAAGALGVRWLPFTLAQLPGALAWGVVYATIGLAAWEAALGAALSSPLLLALLGSVLLLAAGTVVTRRLRAR